MMVLVFSQNANNSDEIKKEIALASQRRITVVPVRVEDATPSKAFRYELATRNWIDLFPDWEAGVARLVDRLAQVLSLPIEPQRPLPAAPAPKPRKFVAYGVAAAVAIAVAAGVGWAVLRPAPPLPPIIPTPMASAAVNPPAASPTPSAAPSAALRPVLRRDAAQSAAPSPSPFVAASPAPSVAVATASAVASANPASQELAAPAAPAASPANLTLAAPSAQPALSAKVIVAVSPPPALAADDPGGETFRECDQCPEMVIVPAGKAVLGSPAGEGGRQTVEPLAHEVDFAKPFAVGRFAVTFEEWDACFAEGGCGRRRLGDLDFGRGRRPAIFATWNDAQTYVAWLSRKTGHLYRLLSEAEWEYSARGCATLKCPYAPFWFGPIAPELAVYDWRRSYQGSPKANPPLETEPVDRGPVNPFGLYNILGNVRQWMQDCWSATGAPAIAAGGDCKSHATRGGSWADEPSKLRAAARDWEMSDEGSEKIGFRVARSLAP